MKRWIAILLSMVFIVATLTSCIRFETAPQDSAASETESEATGATEESETAEVPPSTEAPEEDLQVSPLMWHVTDQAGHEMYLFGTIHVGDERNEEVLDLVTPVLDECDALAVEFDIVAYEEDANAIAEQMKYFVLTDGTTITDYMPKDLYDRACEFLGEAGLPAGLLSNYNLSFWSQLIKEELLYLYSDLDSDYGMDDQLIHYAYSADIPVLNVESAEFQMNLLAGFSDELYLMQIESSLEIGEDYGDSLLELYEGWLYDDCETFWAIIAEEDEEETDDSGELTEEQIAIIKAYNKTMLDDRNLGMRDKALEYLASGQTVFFAVGAAHMANEMGLVNLLREAGCTVEEFDYIGK